jgi:hypothetical protein
MALLVFLGLVGYILVLPLDSEKGTIIFKAFLAFYFVNRQLFQTLVSKSKRPV